MVGGAVVVVGAVVVTGAAVAAVVVTAVVAAAVVVVAVVVLGTVVVPIAAVVPAAVVPRGGSSPNRVGTRIAAAVQRIRSGRISKRFFVTLFDGVATKSLLTVSFVYSSPRSIRQFSTFSYRSVSVKR